MSDLTTYDRLSRFNHWVIAAAVIGMLCFGFYLEYGGLPREAKGSLIGIHKAIGVLVLLYGLWRVAWRLAQGFPADIPGMPKWQAWAARAVHWALLVLVVLMPLSGLVASIYGGRAVDVFGWFTIPARPEIAWLSGLGGAVHGWTAIALSLLIAIHVAAALRHHFIDHDGTLLRMVSGRHATAKG